LMLKMGKLDHRLIEAIQKHADSIYELIKQDSDEQPLKSLCPPVVFKTQLGCLYQGDCINLLQNLADNSVDLIFADPPFNLNKLYPSGINDNLKEAQYLKWCEKWLEECVRVLSPGGRLLTLSGFE
jgi:site-specific DNA-methyltransferase (adenine-specific)